jgi:hypothetical protein
MQALFMAIDAAQHDLAEGDQTVEQRDRSGFGAERPAEACSWVNRLPFVLGPLHRERPRIEPPSNE